MAKFKVGDRVRFTAGPIKGEYGKIISLGKKDGCYDVQSAYGEILTNTPEGELAKNSSVSTNPVVANALAARNATVATNARLTYQQAVSMAKDAIKKMKDINAKVKPWREQMKQMRKTWDSIDVDFFYNIDKDGLDENQKSNIESLYKEFERVRQDGYYNFYSV